MPSPAESWRTVIAADGVTEVAVKRRQDGTASVRLSSGLVSMVASLPAHALDFLLAERATPPQTAEAA